MKPWIGSNNLGSIGAKHQSSWDFIPLEDTFPFNQIGFGKNMSSLRPYPRPLLTKKSRGKTEVLVNQSNVTLKKRDDEKWMKHILGFWENEEVRLEYRSVQMNTLDDEVETFPPKA
ncbi:hypothetical protein LIER_06458 [Lithospermum erythrorhizon]|uniref:Fumarate reductase/succinate dehydrogenase flavoprotein-like C-terminal domain-containing protein n=1 Tax=Lithospermum erythrorhizon TaxID=34254 RepID=A0AAV3P750_LITER